MPDLSVVLQAAARIVGEGHVSADEGVLNGLPVVHPGCPKEVSRLLKSFTERNIRVVSPFLAERAQDPEQACLVMALDRLDRIVSLNHDDRYAVIEAGVTESALAREIERQAPGLQFNKSLDHRHLPVAANAMADGIGILSYKYGGYAEMVNGLEVVLDTGEICRLGASALSESWFTHGSVPFLNGLFLNRIGQGGIITKLACRLYPAPVFSERITEILPFGDMIPDTIYRLSYTEFPDAIAIKLPSGQGDIEVHVTVSGNTPDELELKKRFLGWGKQSRPAGETLESMPKPKPGEMLANAVFPVESATDGWRAWQALAGQVHADIFARMIVLDQGHQVCLQAGIVSGQNFPCNTEQILNMLDATTRTSGGILLDVDGVPPDFPRDRKGADLAKRLARPPLMKEANT